MNVGAVVSCIVPLAFSIRSTCGGCGCCNCWGRELCITRLGVASCGVGGRRISCTPCGVFCCTNTGI
uniref:Putative secreted protein n=1 Tax=Anopheles darlingi TaxID=43151 RepID=A0A2M4DR89_ANODA